MKHSSHCTCSSDIVYSSCPRVDGLHAVSHGH